MHCPSEWQVEWRKSGPDADACMLAGLQLLDPAPRAFSCYSSPCCHPCGRSGKWWSRCPSSEQLSFCDWWELVRKCPSSLTLWLPGFPRGVRPHADMVIAGFLMRPVLAARLLCPPFPLSSDHALLLPNKLLLNPYLRVCFQGDRKLLEIWLIIH